MENIETFEEQIREKIRNQFIFDYVKKYSSVELDILINQFAAGGFLIDDEIVSYSEIHSFLLLEKFAGNNIKDIIKRYFYEYNFDEMEYMNFINSLSYRELILVDSIITSYSSPALIELNGNPLSDLIKLIIDQSRKSNELVRSRKKEKNEIE